MSECRPSLETVSVGVWIDVGSRHEPAQLNGITHFLEHMLFKGTAKRSAKDIVMEIEAVGGHLNAYTSRENTTYYARILKDDLPLALDILSDILLNSVCDPAEVEREKDVILQEIGQAIDTPDDIVFDHLQRAAYGEQPLGRTILGEPEIIRTFTQSDLLTYLKQNYVTSNIVISAVGNLDHEQLVQMVEERFCDLPVGPPIETSIAAYIGGHKAEYRKLEQLHLTAAWPAVSFHAPEYYALQVYSTILGGGMSSRLFQEVREHRGLAYSVYSFTSSHKETGILGIYAGTGPEMAAGLMPVIKQEMESLCKGPEEGEFLSAKAQLKASLMMGLEATTSRMEQLGRQLLIFDRIISTSEMISNVEGVTVDQVSKVSDDIFSCSNSSIAIVGDGELGNFT
ncbi:M16 family metallopeptidase [Kordiimonas pumila]|uniref:M16 family metallopeptidase n=1 Tax=Kordiimonas pumila TaxID=2161677 RepID=A0ABV7D8D4_9PROT|nr:pitrilysin family protein [Kordiimonas pumila]